MPDSRSRGQRYRVVFRGQSEVLAAAFPEFESEYDGDNTALVGTIVDQAQLLGLVDRANSLGFVVVSLNPIGDGEFP